MDQQQFLILFTFFLFIFRVLKKLKKYNQDYVGPPGPWKFPILGNIPHLLASNDLTHQLFRNWAQIYGSVMGLKFGQVPVVVISSAEAAKEVMKTQGEVFAERPMLDAKIVHYNQMDIVFGPYGDHWRQMRKIWILEFLSVKRVQNFRPIREDAVLNAMNFLRSKGRSPVNLTKVTFELSTSM